MKKILLMALALSIGMTPFESFAADLPLRFDGGIGVIPLSGAGGPQSENGTFQNVNRNDVRGVPPGGQPWVIRTLSAQVRGDGFLTVQGEGLLLAGGNNIGFNGNASVFATLFCGNVEHSTALEGVPLEQNGNFRITGMLTPTPPDPCDAPVLLIRSSNGGRWFAAGIAR